MFKKVIVVMVVMIMAIGGAVVFWCLDDGCQHRNEYGECNYSDECEDNDHK